MSTERQGVLYGIGAYLLWGLLTLYFAILKPVAPLEILAHRVLWTLLFVTLLLAFRRRWAWLGAIVHDRRRLLILGVASVVIAVNWGVYIWSVNNAHVVEAALGYYVNPLVTVLLGVVVLHERLRPLQWTAVGLATLAVVVLTIDTGRPPWIALVLAVSFATYGLMKNRVRMPALESLSVETALLAVPALVVLLVLQAHGTATFGHTSVHRDLLLLSLGVVTAVPLLLFAAAAARVPLTTMGLLQYITPTTQLLLGVAVLDEPMSTGRWLGFAIVWAALVIFTVDSLRTSRRSRAAAAAAAGDYSPVP